MRKIERLFIGAGLVAGLVVIGSCMWNSVKNTDDNSRVVAHTDTKYGAFLAAQHAITVNDFERAAEFSAALTDVDYAVVQNTRLMSRFLSGQMPSDAKMLKSEKSMVARLMYDAWLIDGDDWAGLHARHKKDESALAAPLRIWSAIANNYKTDTFNFIKSLPTNESWKSFMRGQIYAQLGDIKRAAENFAGVETEFMNINDYLYMMSFYMHHDMTDRADALRADFTSKPGGMFMLNYDAIPDWSVYTGYKNALAFSLVQNVSHTQIMMYSDLAILLLRFAQITAPEFAQNNNTVDYYMGQFFYTNAGDYAKYFSRVSSDSPFYLFATLRMAERDGDYAALESALREHPLFVPAVTKMVAHYTSLGNRRAALRIVNRALSNDDISDVGHAFFLKNRAQIYFMFGDFDAAQSDLHAASDILIADPDILSIQAKIWAAQNREIETAYEYAMTLVKRDPTDIFAWDTLGCVVATREGAAAALDLLTRVGEVSSTDSGLFERLGDLYVETGDNASARDAYTRALELADDGLVIIPSVKRKLRKIK